ncbi:unnamed protein product [Cyclocybe aegerita]|uniref:Uncharacterized protein n=1 Tax=Cyclocybe aegerita TaxID=1973307 RepID=A0A8S0WCH3_CYCAE|nr:unnamed protein product [Cyclocybe aegerita]
MSLTSPSSTRTTLSSVPFSFNALSSTSNIFPDSTSLIRPLSIIRCPSSFRLSTRPSSRTPSATQNQNQNQNRNDLLCHIPLFSHLPASRIENANRVLMSFYPSHPPLSVDPLFYDRPSGAIACSAPAMLEVRPYPRRSHTAPLLNQTLTPLTFLLFDSTGN